MLMRLRGWRDETHGASFELVRHFLARLFDSEMFSTPGQWTKVGIGIISTVIPASLLFLPVFWRRYSCVEMGRPSSGCPAVTDYQAAYLSLVRADELWFIGLAMCMTALVTAIQWQALFPSRADNLALASLPVSTRQIFAAKFVAVFLAFTAFVLAMNLAPSVLFAAVTSGRWQENPSALANIAGTFIATSCGCGFAFFSLLALHGMLLNLPPRLFDRVSVYAQTAIFTLSVAALPFLWQQPRDAAWWPPTWFVGLWAAVIGAGDGASRNALLALAIAPAVAAAAYSLGYSRYRKLVVETAPAAPSQWRSVCSRLLDYLIRDPRERAVFAFIWKTISRSRVHRLVLQAYAGLGLAWAVKGIAEHAGAAHADATGAQFAVVFAPLSVSVFVIFGLRQLFALPSALRANWIFRTLGSEGQDSWLRAVERFVPWCGVAPIYVCALPGAGAAFGWWEALRISAFGYATAMLGFELVFRNWSKVPFTCSYVPGKRPLWQVLLLGLAGLPVLALASAATVSLAHHPLAFIAAFPLEIALLRSLRKRRRERWHVTALIYEEFPEPAVETLGIPVERQAQGESLDSSTGVRTTPFWNPLTGAERTSKHWDLSPFVKPGGVIADIRHGLRLIRRNPLLSSAVVATMSLGIGLNAGVFTLVSGIAFRARVTDPDTFVRVWPRAESKSGPSQPGRASDAEYRAYRERSRTLRSLAAWNWTTANLLDDHSSTAKALLVSCNFFSVYGLERARLGRLFQADECSVPGQAPVTVISEEMWRERLGANPQIVGQTIRVNDRPFTVVGVAPAGFAGRVNGGALWLPYTAQPYLEPAYDLFQSENAWLILEGRLAPGSSRAAAQAELRVIAGQLDALRPGRKTALSLKDGSWISLVMGAESGFNVERIAWLMALVAGSLGMVLLITCANVTTLLLSRAVSRRREIAVRLSLGAPRLRLLRMLLTENLLLSAASGCIGLFIAYAAPQALFRFLANAPADFPLTPDWRIFAYTVGIVLLTGCLSGLVPAFESLRVDLACSLKGYEARLGSVATGRRLRGLLAGSQMALSLVLLIFAGLVANGYRTFSGGPTGFDSRNALVVPVRFPAAQIDGSSQALFRRITDRIRALPGIQLVSYANEVPLLGSSRVNANLPGRDARPVGLNRVSPGYFAALGIPILRGREYFETDLPASGTSGRAVVSEAFVRAFFPGEDPVGRSFQTPGVAYEIIGVAKNVGPSGKDEPVMYSYDEWNGKKAFLLVRFAGDAAHAARAVRSAVREIEPSLGVSPRPLQALFDDAAANVWRIVVLIMILSSAAAALAIGGIYGVIAFTAGQRTRELGIRVALGACHWDIIREVVSFGARPVAGGIAAGLWLSLAVAGAAAQVFLRVPFRWSVGSLAVYAGAPLVLGLAALIAMLVPARRSARSEVVKALRFE